MSKQNRHSPLDFSFDEVLETIANNGEQQVAPTDFETKPFLKWVGGKRSLLRELKARLPVAYTRYYEPFVGGGALFFAHQPQKSYISDANFHLIITYGVVKNDVENLIKRLKIYRGRHCKNFYMKSRDRLNKEQSPLTIAALFIYLNKTCFNGLYRVNKNGIFNVPMGDYKSPNICDEQTLKNASKLLQETIIFQHSFEQTPIEKGAFYYLDPPYHQTFNNYSSNGFSDEIHQNLANLCNKINDSEAFFMLSNSNTSFVYSLYKDYNIEEVSALRTVSCKGNQRGKENEVIIRNYK